MQFIEAQIFKPYISKSWIQTSRPYHPAPRFFITITPLEELAADHEAQAALTAQGLAGAYGDHEPQYSPASIKKPNPGISTVNEGMSSFRFVPKYNLGTSGKADR